DSVLPKTEAVQKIFCNHSAGQIRGPVEPLGRLAGLWIHKVEVAGRGNEVRANRRPVTQILARLDDVGIRRRPGKTKVEFVEAGSQNTALLKPESGHGIDEGQRCAPLYLQTHFATCVALAIAGVDKIDGGPVVSDAK